MSDDKAPKVIIIRETLWESIQKDAFTIGGLIGAILIGWWLDSSALQWIAGLMLIVLVTARATNEYNNQYTVEEAIDKLKRMQGAWGD